LLLDSALSAAAIAAAFCPRESCAYASAWKVPDATWSDWSPVYKDPSGQPISSERARFSQTTLS
jgi:hypothetical protein